MATSWSKGQPGAELEALAARMLALAAPSGLGVLVVLGEGEALHGTWHGVTMTALRDALPDMADSINGGAGAGWIARAPYGPDFAAAVDVAFHMMRLAARHRARKLVVLFGATGLRVSHSHDRAAAWLLLRAVGKMLGRIPPPPPSPPSPPTRITVSMTARTMAAKLLPVWSAQAARAAPAPAAVAAAPVAAPVPAELPAGPAKPARRRGRPPKAKPAAPPPPRKRGRPPKPKG